MFSFLYKGTRAMELFTHNTRVFPRMKFVQKGLNANLERAVSHHEKHDLYISNESMLVRLLNILPTVEPISDSRLAQDVGSMQNAFTTALGIVSEHGTGKPIYGTLYGNIPEVWISETATPEDQPIIRVLRHPFTDTNLPAFTGTETYAYLEPSDIAVMCIDIPRLAVAYRKWVVANRKLPEIERKSTSYYISTELMPTILQSHQQVAMANLLTSRLVGTRRRMDHMTKGLTLVDYTDKTEDAVDLVIEKLLSGTMDINSILTDTPLTQNHTLSDIVGHKPTLDTRTKQWAYFLANAPLLSFLLTVTSISGATYDSSIKKTMKQTFTLMTNDYGILNKLPDEIGTLMKDTVHELRDLL